MILALTPEDLIQQRVAAFMQHDFRAIFHSYHPEAPFLHFFPDCEAYLAYAAAELVDTISISTCEILRCYQQGETAQVLFRQRVIYKGENLNSLEIARCHRDKHGKWFFIAGIRLDTLKLSTDFLHCSWDELLAAGNDLWI